MANCVVPRSTDHATRWNKRKGSAHERRLFGKGLVKWGSMSLFVLFIYFIWFFIVSFFIENGALYKLKGQVKRVAGKPYDLNS